MIQRQKYKKFYLSKKIYTFFTIFKLINYIYLKRAIVFD
ncbi:hypothetical protein Cop2CBH44_19670 [Coprobacter secundus subsp. similis]|uniref:Uncharacterized protein n=1 Tax=Coprobacter secundus subsp. similis TaxID=2751153 RepID=A0A7G1HYT8_9BACT|nr:hypothetical protein Cop2CBH44_19670 [Coprobacter secundus subsp. similis]